jgi:signal peptidase I
MNKNIFWLNGRQKLTEAPKKLWKNEYFQTTITIILIVVIVFGFWYGSQAVLNTTYPAVAVTSGSMCIPYDGACDGWSHPFARTLHIGDLLIIQGVNPANLNTSYPNSDIIVFHEPNDPSVLIVHRIAKVIPNQDGTLSFYTKGDGNPPVRWPNSVQEGGYDPWGAVPQNLVVGKVVMRIPWVGHVVLFMRENPWGVPIIILLILLLVIIEFVLPLFKRGKAPEESKKTP